MAPPRLFADPRAVETATAPTAGAPASLPTAWAIMSVTFFLFSSRRPGGAGRRPPRCPHCPGSSRVLGAGGRHRTQGRRAGRRRRGASPRRLGGLACAPQWHWRPGFPLNSTPVCLQLATPCPARQSATRPGSLGHSITMKQCEGTLVTMWGSQEATSGRALEAAWPTTASPRGHQLRDEKGVGVKVRGRAALLRELMPRHRQGPPGAPRWTPSVSRVCQVCH